MAEYNPPTEDLPIFDVTVFRDVAPYDDFYLKRQGLATSVATETDFSGLVNFNNLTTPPHCSAVPTNPNDLANKAYVDALAPQTSYIVFLNYSQTFTTSTPTIYKKLNPLTNNTPTTVAIHTTNTIPLLIAGFFNTKADLKFANSIPAGLWSLILYANCSAVNDQNHLALNYVLCGVTAGGVESIIETSAYSPLINVLSPLIGTYACVLTVTTAINITAYDQIGIKVYALSNTSANHDGSIYFQYPSYYSTLQTSFATTQAADLTITNNTWTGTNTFQNTTNLNTTIIQGTGTIQFPDTSVQSTAFKSLTSGIYTNSNITVDAQGAISAISTGVGGANAQTIDITPTATGTGLYIPYSITNGSTSTLLGGGLLYNRTTNTLATSVTSSGTVLGGTTGKILYQSGVDTTAFIPVGTPGQILTSAGAAIPTWNTDLTGNAGSATALNLTVASVGAADFIPISATASGNSTLRTNASLTYNHSTNTIAGNVTGSAGTAGSATNIAGGAIGNVLTQSAVGVTTPLVNGGLNTVLTSGGIGVNPSWSANIAGNAGTSTAVALTSDNTSGDYFIPFSKTSSATSNQLYIDNTTTPLSYNPNSSRLSATDYTIGSSVQTAGTSSALINQSVLATLYTNNATIGRHRFYVNDASNVAINAFNVNSTTCDTTVPLSIVTNSTTVPSLTIKNSASTKTTNFIPNAAVGTLNPMVNAGNNVIAASGTIDAETLTLTTWGAVTSGIRIGPLQMRIGAGGSATIPTTNIAIDGSSGVGTLILTSPTCPALGSSHTLPIASDSTTKIATTQWAQTAITAGTSALATGVAGGVIGNVLYQTSADATTKMTNGAANTILTSNGIGAVPTWNASFTGNVLGTATNATNVTVTSDSASSSYQALTFTSNITGNLPAKTRANISTGAGLTYVPTTNVLNVNVGGFGAVSSSKFELVNNLGNISDITNGFAQLVINNNTAFGETVFTTADGGGVLATRFSVGLSATTVQNVLATNAGIISPTTAITYQSNMVGFAYNWSTTAVTFTSGVVANYVMSPAIPIGVWLMFGGQQINRGTGTFSVASYTQCNPTVTSGTATLSTLYNATPIPSGYTGTTVVTQMTIHLIVSVNAVLTFANTTVATVGTATRLNYFTLTRIA